MRPGAFLVEDTRQQDGRHEAKHRAWARMGVRVVRHVLPAGDYALCYGGGVPEGFAPKGAVDTKKDIAELWGNLTAQHERFRRECVRACDQGTQLVVLVENTHRIRCLADLEGWVEGDRSFRRRTFAKERMSGARIAGMCRTMTERYGVGWAFRGPRESARAVLELLEDMERRFGPNG